MDANCLHSPTVTPKPPGEKTAKACAPTSTTTSFAIEAKGGKTYTLDATGNERVASAMSTGSIRPDKDGDVHVTVHGTAQGDTIKVDSVSGRSEKSSH